MKTLQQHAQLAQQVQDACNASGVAHALTRWFSDCEELGVRDTDTRNQHPITVLYVDKLASLAGCQALGHDNVMDAYRKVRELAEGPAS